MKWFMTTMPFIDVTVLLHQKFTPGNFQYFQNENKIYFTFLNVYLFGEREREWAKQGQREKGREKIPTKLRAQHGAPHSPPYQNREIMPWAKVSSSTDWATQVPQKFLDIIAYFTHGLTNSVYCQVSIFAIWISEHGISVLF